MEVWSHHGAHREFGLRAGPVPGESGLGVTTFWRNTLFLLSINSPVCRTTLCICSHSVSSLQGDGVQLFSDSCIFPLFPLRRSLSILKNVHLRNCFKKVSFLLSRSTTVCKRTPDMQQKFGVFIQKHCISASWARIHVPALWWGRKYLKALKSWEFSKTKPLPCQLPYGALALRGEVGKHRLALADRQAVADLKKEGLDEFVLLGPKPSFAGSASMFLPLFF